MSQNLCILCCYSFQAKRTRLISDEAQESFQKFCDELGVSQGNGALHGIKDLACSGLELPYGENVTICGDCLSLVVPYVQKRNVQREKEDKLLELQRAVCVALRELQEVVEEVQVRIDKLHSTMRLGDESYLDSFCKRAPNKENNPRAFREKVFRLNTGFVKGKSNLPKNVDKIPIIIKAEPMDQESFSAGDIDSPAQFEEKSASSSKDWYAQNLPDHSVSPDCDWNSDNSSYSGCSDSSGSNYSGTGKSIKRKRNKLLKHSPPKKKRAESFIRPKDSYLTPSQWKDNLISRILMQMNNDIHEETDLSQPPQTVTSSNNRETCVEPAADINPPVSSSFQFIHGKLNLRGTIVNIREEHHALQCTKCGKNYFEERDVIGDSPLESLMRDHILWKHYGESQRKGRVRYNWLDIQPISNVELEQNWRINFTSDLKSKRVIFFYCALGKKRLGKCPVILKKTIRMGKDQDGGMVEQEVEFQINDKEHENHRPFYVGLTPENKRFVEDLYKRNHAILPNEILRMFRKHGKTEPEKSKLVCFLRGLRKKESST